MPLVVDQLSLWVIGFKWAGLDPNRLWLQIPTPARDNFSTLLNAILSEHLDCLTLSSQKYSGDDELSAMAHIRSWMDDVYAGVSGQDYNRKLLRWAIVDRGSFQDWCERCSIPLPEFWFPPGWTDYRWPEYDLRSEFNTEQQHKPVPNKVEVEVVGVDGASAASQEPAAMESFPKELRDNQIARVASQQIARVIWKEEPDKTIAAMCKDERILKYGGAQYYVEEVIRRWLRQVAPAAISAKRGRPKKQNPTEDE